MSQPTIRFAFPGERLCFTDPDAVVVADGVADVLPCLRQVEAATRAGYFAAGYVAYEAAPAFDPAFAVHSQPATPLLWFGIFQQPAAAELCDSGGSYQLSEWQPVTSRPVYDRAIARIHDAIACGDTYQVNYTTRLLAQFTGDAFALYRRLRAAQPKSFGAFLDLGHHQIVSVSPELFFHWRHGLLESRPMKGTAQRGRWLEEDAAQAEWLARSEKNRAENTMIVDLVRNDIGRVARVGSVHVPQLFDIERHRTVFQMTSTVLAQTRPETTLTDVFTALFPAGSITGAPKISTTRLIAELEDRPRGVYCGAIGLVKPGGEALFSVAIRTVSIDRGIAEYGVGGGITWDSTAIDEYAEVQTKAAILTESWPAFDLLETMRLDDGVYALRHRHLQRLSESAHYFDIPMACQDVERIVDEHARSHSTGGWRVRLLLSQAGVARIESVPLVPLGDSLTVVLATSPVSRHDRFLFHKTTNRTVYDCHRAKHPGVFDVLLWNERCELTECTTGNIVVEIDGHCWTPARECGLLAGTLRAELLESGEIAERVIMVSELASASRLWLINGVRGWVPVTLVQPAG